MKFWDSSALLALLIEEEASGAVAELFRKDRRQVVWCLSEVEVASALARRASEGLLPAEAERARQDVLHLADRWTEVTSLEDVRSRAVRLVGVHRLRAANALQLGAALVASDEKPENLPFVSLDNRLSGAARKEGFRVLP